MELKELIGEDLWKQTEEKLNGHTVIIAAKDEKYIKDDGNWIPKTRFNEVIEQKNTYKETKEELEKQIGLLKTKLKDNSEIDEQLTQLQNDLKDRDEKVVSITKKYALKDSLRDEKVRYPELLMTKFDLSSIELTEEGKIKGFDKLFEPIKKDYPDLIGDKKIPGTDGQGPGSGEAPTFSLDADQKKQAYAMFPHFKKEEAEEAWYEIQKKRGKIK